MSNGIIYQGQWLDEELHGAGVLIDKKGNVYEGYFEDGVYHGFGR